MRSKHVFVDLFPTILSIIISAGIFYPCLIQSQPIDLPFQHLTPSDYGFESQYHVFIKRDSKGFVWISSTLGANRFDGVSIKKFTPDTYPSMLGVNIQSDFFEDSEGNIWFSTMKGINRYEYGTDSISNFRITSDDSSFIENDYALFHIERDSILWVEVEGTIYRYNYNSGNQHSIVKTEGARFTVDTLADGTLNAIIACPWFNNSGIEYIKLNPEGNPTQTLYLKEVDFHGIGGPIIVSKAIVQDHKNIWIISQQGLILLDLEDPQNPVPYYNPNSADPSILDGFLYEDRYLWINSYENGLYIFDTQARAYIQHITHKEDNSHSLSSNSNLGVYIDDTDHLWVSSRDHAAIDYAWLNPHKFFNPVKANLAGNQIIYSIAQDHKGFIYCLSQLNKVHVFNEEQEFIKSLYFPTSSNGGNSNRLALSTDEYGMVWAFNGPKIYKLEGDRWLEKYHSQQGNIISLIHKSSSNKIIATNKGVFELRQTDSSTGKYPLYEKLSYQGGEVKVYWLIEKESGTLYGQNSSKDLFEISFPKDQEASIAKWKMPKDIFSIYEDSLSGLLIIGTSEGLFSLDRSANKVTRLFTSNNELKRNPIHNIFRDSRKRLWFSSNTTLYVSLPGDSTLYHFSQEGEFEGGQFTHFSFLKTSHESIWLGSHDGAIVFMPDSLEPNPYASQVFLESLLANSTPLALSNSLNSLSELTLPYYKNQLELNALAISTYLPFKNHITYKLGNYHEDWKTVDNGSPIEFNNLIPGTYSFQIRGINANGVTGKEHSLQIQITPPLWQKPWFIATSAFFGLLFLILFIQWTIKLRLRKQEAFYLQQQQIKEALEGERTRIAEEMHDDLGSGLNSIRLILNRVKAPNISKEIKIELNKIENYANDSIENMQEIIWAMNSSNDSLEELIAFTRIYVLEFFEDHKLPCNSNMPEYLPSIQISGEKRRNIFLCVKEGAHNILKHAQASQVYLQFSINDQLSISLQDNGTGINLNQVRKGANGLKNMKKRIGKIGGRMEIIHDNGTLLSFHIPLEHLKQSAMNTN